MDPYIPPLSRKRAILTPVYGPTRPHQGINWTPTKPLCPRWVILPPVHGPTRPHQGVDSGPYSALTASRPFVTKAGHPAPCPWTDQTPSGRRLDPYIAPLSRKRAILTPVYGPTRPHLGRVDSGPYSVLTASRPFVTKWVILSLSPPPPPCLRTGQSQSGHKLGPSLPPPVPIRPIPLNFLQTEPLY